MKVMSIFGTRPEMIKMWGTLKKLDSLNFEHIMVHTGQNHSAFAVIGGPAVCVAKPMRPIVSGKSCVGDNHAHAATPSRAGLPFSK